MHFRFWRMSSRLDGKFYLDLSVKVTLFTLDTNAVDAL